MSNRIWIARWLLLALFCLPIISFSATPVHQVVFFGDSLSDNGNTTHLLKSLRRDESPAFLVAPFKTFVINRMIQFANDYYVPQMILDEGISRVTQFFDYELAPYLVDLISRIKLVPVLPGKPYWNARFSNGPVWSDYLSVMLVGAEPNEEEPYINQAFGGSWAVTYDYQLTTYNLIRHPIATIKTLIVGKLIPPSLGLTVQAFLLGHEQLDKEAVYFLFTGANDYLNVLVFDDNYNTSVMSAYIDNTLEGIGYAVRRLTYYGAKHFVVMGLPHIGSIPRYVGTSDGEVLDAAIDVHNERLQARIEQWQRLYPETDFLYIDTQKYLARALDNPTKYGFKNTTDACIDVKYPMFGALAGTPYEHNYVLHYSQVLQYQEEQMGPSFANYHVCTQPTDYLFWDDVHPTTRAHEYLAAEVCLEMKAYGYAVNCKSPGRF